MKKSVEYRREALKAARACLRALKGLDEATLYHHEFGWVVNPSILVHRNVVDAYQQALTAAGFNVWYQRSRMERIREGKFCK